MAGGRYAFPSSAERPKCREAFQLPGAEDSATIASWTETRNRHRDELSRDSHVRGRWPRQPVTTSRCFGLAGGGAGCRSQTIVEATHGCRRGQRAWFAPGLGKGVSASPGTSVLRTALYGNVWQCCRAPADLAAVLNGGGRVQRHLHEGRPWTIVSGSLLDGDPAHHLRRPAETNPS
jgi:hypothetical protein